MTDLPIEEEAITSASALARSRHCLPRSPDQHRHPSEDDCACLDWVRLRSLTHRRDRPRKQMPDDAKNLVRRLRKFTKLPIAVGFGISTSEQFAAIEELPTRRWSAAPS